MVAVHVRARPLTDRERAELVFAGDIVIFRAVPALAELGAHARALLAEVLEVAEPEGAHTRWSAAELAERVSHARQRFRRDPRVAELVRAGLAHVGVDLARACWDWCQLRALAPVGSEDGSRPTAPLRWHRDTWASNVLAQVNWWAPLAPLDRERTLAFVPPAFARAVPNTSADWTVQRARAGTIPIVPVPEHDPEPAETLRVVCEPGDLVCFSGAHLHGSVPNRTDRVRYSFEVRTVSLDDLAAGRAAPNVDGAAPEVQRGWFRHVHDGRPLSDLIVEENA